MAQLDSSPALPSSVAISENLSNEQRQQALEILRTRNQPIALADLGEDKARARNPDIEGKPDFETVRRLRLKLYHTHIPKLVDTGLVIFDSRNRTVHFAVEDSHPVECFNPKERSEF